MSDSTDAIDPPDLLALPEPSRGALLLLGIATLLALSRRGRRSADSARTPNQRRPAANRPRAVKGAKDMSTALPASAPQYQSPVTTIPKSDNISVKKGKLV